MNNLKDNGNHNRVNPFPGLRYYTIEEAAYYYIEPRKQNEILTQLIEDNFLVAAGKPGCGKASVLHCAIIPRLVPGLIGKAGENWVWTLFRPGTNPVRNLAEHLANCGIFLNGGSIDLNFADDLEKILRASSDGLFNIFNEYPTKEGHNLFLAIDELEDIFILHELMQQDDDITIFVNLLLRFLEYGHPNVYMMWALDSTFLGESAQYPRLPEAINRGQYLLTIPDKSQLRKLIKHAFKAANIDVDDYLIEHIINTYASDSTHLYSLQQVLKRFVDRYWADGSRPDKITMEYFAKEVQTLETLVTRSKLNSEVETRASNAIEVHAEEIYESFTDREQKICEVLFKVITKDLYFGLDQSLAISINRLAGIAECRTNEMIKVISTFFKKELFLLHIVGADGIEGRLEALAKISDNPYPELTPHSKVMLLNPVFIKLWKRLDYWKRVEREDAEIYLRLTEAESIYTKNGKVGLYIDPQLSEAVKWRDDGFHNKEWSSRYALGYEDVLVYLKKSEEKNRRDEERAVQEAQRKQRLNKWIRWGLVAACVIFSGLATWALFEQQKVKVEKEHVNYIQNLDSIHTIYVDALEDIASGQIELLVEEIKNPIQTRSSILKFANQMADDSRDCKDALVKRIDLITELKNQSSKTDMSDEEVDRWRLHRDSLAQHDFCIVIRDHCFREAQYIYFYKQNCAE